MFIYLSGGTGCTSLMQLLHENFNISLNNRDDFDGLKHSMPSALLERIPPPRREIIYVQGDFTQAIKSLGKLNSSIRIFNPSQM